jgi:hypothetical protein
MERGVCFLQSQRTRVNEAHLQPFFSKIMNEDCSIDNSMSNCTSYYNTNALQCAACEGDVQLLERLVGMGAALDYSADNLSAVSSRSPKSLLAVHLFFLRLAWEGSLQTVLQKSTYREPRISYISSFSVLRC